LWYFDGAALSMPLRHHQERVFPEAYKYASRLRALLAGQYADECIHTIEQPGL
jgi:hypothetical protein